MPKRYKVFRGSSWTWIYEDTDFKPPALLAESKERWETKKEAKDAISEMKKAPVVEEE